MAHPLATTPWRVAILLALTFLSLPTSVRGKDVSVVRQLYDKAMALADKEQHDEAFALFQKAQQTKGAERDAAYPLVLNQLAAYAFNDGETERATQLNLDAARRLPESDHENLSTVYMELGIFYRHREMTDSSLHYYNKALHEAMALGDAEMLTQLNMNVAVLYHSMKRFKEASRHIDQGLTHARKVKDPFVRFCILQVGGAVKGAAGQTREAVPLARQAWQIATGRDGSDDLQMRCIPTMCTVLDAIGQTDSVYHYIAIGTRLLQSPNVSTFNQNGFLQCRAEINYRHQRWRECLDDLLLLKDEGVMSKPANSVYEHIAVCYDHLGREHEAYVYMDSARMWTDTLAAKDMEGRLAEFHVKYQTQEKELQLTQMQVENARQRTLWTTVAFLLVLVVVLLAVVIFVTRHRHKLAAVRQREEANLNEARQYISGLEGERKRLAEELHNGVANDLLGFQLQLESQPASSGLDNTTELVSRLAKIRDDVRSISHGLMPPEFTHLDLVTILDRYVASLSADASVEVVFDSLPGDDWSALPKATAYEVFRIAQEWMANAQKHAAARHIVVSLEQHDGAGQLEIADDGCGIDSERQGRGIGLRVIEDRVRVIRGQWNVESDDIGTHCSLIFPLK